MYEIVTRRGHWHFDRTLAAASCWFASMLCVALLLGVGPQVTWAEPPAVSEQSAETKAQRKYSTADFDDLSLLPSDKRVAQINHTWGLGDKESMHRSIEAQRELVEQRCAQLGEKHWLTVESRAFLDIITRLSQMNNREISEVNSILEIRSRAGQAMNEGKYEDAVMELADALGLASRVWGKDSLPYVQLVEEYAEAFLEWDGLKQAIEYTSQARDFHERHFGRCHPRTIRNLKRLAILYASDHKFVESKRTASEGFEAAGEVFGPDDTRTLALAILVAAADGRKHHYQRAIELLEDVSARLERTSQADCITYAEATQRRAELYYQLGRYEQTLGLLQSPAHRRILEKAFDVDAPECLQTETMELAARWGLGHDLVLIERDLCELTRRVKRTLGLVSTEGKACLWMRGKLLAAMHEWDAALSTFVELSSMASQTPADSGEDYAKSLGCIAFCLSHLQRHDEALAIARQSVKILSDIGETEPVSLAHQQVNLARVLIRAGKIDEVEDLIAGAMLVLKRELSEGHVDLAHPILARAELQLHRREYQAAEAALQLALQHREQALGETSLHLLEPLEHLKTVYGATDRHDHSETIAQRIQQIQRETGLECLLIELHP